MLIEYIDSDISRDGIYSSLFYPIADGTFTVSFHAVHYTNTNGRDNILKDTRLITSDQGTEIFKIYCNN